MTFKASDSLCEQIAQYLAERIIRGELRPGQRIQELKVTQELNVSRGSVREALLILERRHLVVILPRRGAQVSELSAPQVRGLCALMTELYILLGNAVAQRWQSAADLAPFREIQQRMVGNCERRDIRAFVEDSFDVMRASFRFADNLYLQETVENLQPAMSRTYYLALEQRKAQMRDCLEHFNALLAAVMERDLARVRSVLTEYTSRNRDLVLGVLAH